jgi:cyclic lactone autoinducer peptide
MVNLKQSILQVTAKAVKQAAYLGSGTRSLFIVHEPKVPESLKALKNKKA